MDSKILKFAGKMAVVLAVFCLLFLAIVPDSASFFFLFPFLSLVTGFISVYFLRKEKQSFGAKGYLSLICILAAAYAVLTPLLYFVSLPLFDRHVTGLELPGYFIISIGSFFFSFILSAFGVFFAIMLLTGREERKREEFRKVRRAIAYAGVVIIALIIIVQILYWQFAMPPDFREGKSVATGWAYLQPLSQSIVYSAGGENFTATFMNTVGIPIKVDAIAARETISGTSCTGATVNDVAIATPQTIGAGDMAKVWVDCTGANKNLQDTYEMNITLTYESILGATATTHIDRGTIRGPAE